MSDDLTHYMEAVSRLRAENEDLRAALAQADLWILLHRIDGKRDGACAECFPGSEIPPAFAGFRCAWHLARARAALPGAAQPRGEHDAPDEHPAWMKCSHGVLLPLRCTACEAPPAAAPVCECGHSVLLHMTIHDDECDGEVDGCEGTGLCHLECRVAGCRCAPAAPKEEAP